MMNPHDKTERRAGVGLLLIFIFLAAGIVASGVLFYGNYKKHFRTEIDRQLSAVAELKVNELVEWRAERFADASLFYKNASFSGLVRRFFERPNDAAARDQLRTWLGHVQAAYDYNRVFLLDAHGAERISVPDTPEKVALHLIQHAPEILRSGKVTFVDFHRDAPDGPIHMSLLVPILEGGDNTRPMGILVLRIDPQRYLYPYIDRWPTSSRTAETLIVRRDGNDALYLNELRFQKNTALNLRIPLGKRDVPAVKAVLGEEGTLEGVDYRGVPVLAALRPVPASPWFLVARMDIAEAYAPLRERLWMVIALVGSLLLGASGGIGFIWRHQRARFYAERYEAADALRAVSLRQEALLTAVPDIIMEADGNNVCTWANRAGLQFFGEEVVGKEAAFYFEGEQETCKTVRPLLSGGENVIYVESWQRRRDGEKRLLAWWRLALKDKNGHVTGALSSARDITEQKRAEDALRESEERFRTLYENSTLGLYRTTPEGRIVLANPALVKMLGYSSFEELAGRDLRTGGFEPAYSRAGFIEMMEKESAVSGLESAWTRRDGTTVFVRESARATRDPEGRTLHFDGTVEDITEGKGAEQELVVIKRIADIFLMSPGDEMYDEVLKIILEVMESPLGVFGYLDRAGDLVAPSMTLHIWDRCRVPKKTITFPRETWGDSSWPRAIREKEPNFSNEISTGTPEGHISLRRHISLPILFQGEVIGLFLVANKDVDYAVADIRKLEAIARQLAPILSVRVQRERHVRELREKNDELLRFTYTVSHDLKSPLVTIRTFLGYLGQDLQRADFEAVNKDLGYIRDAADKMSRLLDELLELSRIGRKMNPPAEVPLQDVVQDALALAAGRITDRGVNVEVTNVPVLLYGDRPRLVEIFLNLVDNAAKFMGDERAPRVEIGVEQAGEETVLFVRDNGIGIDLRHQSKLFNLFEKLDSGSEGTGIGLALVRRIVEVHGGKIWVESAGPGRGSTFRFTLAKTKRKSA